MALLALVLGVFGAVYFQRSETGPDAQIANNAAPTAPPAAPAKPEATPAPEPAAPPPAIAPSENKPQDQAAVPRESIAPSAPAPAPQTAQAPPPIPAPSEARAPQTLPQNQPTNTLTSPATPAPDREAERLSQIAPSAAPANVAAAAPRYWVEFGAYAGALYANRLKQRLSQLGIETTVTSAPGKAGRRYLRVRSAADSDRAVASAQRAKAQAALHIAPLLHRVAAVSPAPARAPEAIAKQGKDVVYWVQFGAFRDRRSANGTARQLSKKGIQTTVIKRKSGGLKPLYLIRASGLRDRAAAARVARQGSAALHSHDVLIGKSRAAPGLHPRPPPR